MKAVYPIVLTKGESHVVVYIPDFNINTQGKDVAEAIEMARDAIGLVGIDMQDDHEKIPEPTDISAVNAQGGIATLVDVDFDEYRRKNEVRAVKKNCTLPGWLCYEAEKANINFSQVLQNALMEYLHLNQK